MQYSAGTPPPISSSKRYAGRRHRRFVTRSTRRFLKKNHQQDVEEDTSVVNRLVESRDAHFIDKLFLDSADTPPSTNNKKKHRNSKETVDNDKDTTTRRNKRLCSSNLLYLMYGMLIGYFLLYGWESHQTKDWWSFYYQVLKETTSTTEQEPLLASTIGGQHSSSLFEEGMHSREGDDPQKDPSSVSFTASLLRGRHGEQKADSSSLKQRQALSAAAQSASNGKDDFSSSSFLGTSKNIPSQHSNE